jgi:hypothetical protein
MALPLADVAGLIRTMGLVLLVEHVPFPPKTGKHRRALVELEQV